MKKFFVLIVCAFVSMASYEAHALDPLAAAAGSDVAADVAGQVLPMVTNSAGVILNSGVTIVKDTLGVLWLPVGAVESTVGAPFGLFGHGITNIVDGCAAPFRVAGDVISLPFELAGAK